ncbi:GNAT family N-acetyltransferase [Rhodohalobacter sp. SW132]|uniref:GNAT family N-acetyltransferase n=1 Tax=Rhodohalobacter sp. SW132 TaxID=2293433 RepID=UPI000E2517E2|nr:GNAT family N-acetyltransferase [Rhodohalobacter sp. SW132]REL33251.1 GNAT family N-acetyltransferase [Rhodohalobacter sp. SW132]
MKWILYNSLEECTIPHLYEILKLREEVFIIEQDCIYDDIDGIDYVSSHLLMLDDAILAGYLRMVPAGEKFNEISLGRIVIRKKYRGKRLGKELIQKGLEESAKKGSEMIRIEAQAHLEDYYSEFGFKTDSEIYDVDGIPHLQMLVNYKEIQD